MREIYIYAGWLENSSRQEPLIGEYRADRAAGVVMFRYSREWREHFGIALDPLLPLTDGWQYLSHPGAEGIFGFLGDSSPDRWGRGLLRGRERYLACRENRRPGTLLAEDVLLGVSDEGRSGGLRFKEDPEGPYLAAGEEIPKITQIRRLEQAVQQYESPKEREKGQWLGELPAAGASLGGARPKANVRDLDQSLWMAKFPSRQDQTDVGAWEMVAHDLAQMCGIWVPEARLMPGSSSGHIYLSRRFDRGGGGERVHFASAMTALGETDHGAAQSGKSFLDMAEFIAANSDRPQEDLRELFRRVIFSVCISNTDCHFRNHAFLLEGRSWRFSPAYDLNPDVEKGELAIPITDTEAAIDLNLVLETADFYRIGQQEAEEMAEGIRGIVAGSWRKIAGRYGISASEQEYMSEAFITA